MRSKYWSSGWLAAALIALLAAPAVAGSGRIVVNDDEWAFTDLGIALNPEGALFALNVADWFTDGQPGQFLVYSHHIGLASPALAQAMTAAGHTWDVTTVPNTIDLAVMQGYDAIWLGGVPVDNAALTQYVQGGGNVYLMAGTAWAPSAAAEAAYWNVFLTAFGLAYDTSYNGIGNFPIPVAGTHPILAGVTGLYHSSGQTVIDLDPADSAATILVDYMGVGIVAAYESPVASTYCVAKTDSVGCTPSIGWSGKPSATNSAPFDLASGAIRGKTNGHLMYGLSGSASLPFRGGTLCVAPPLRRTKTVQSGGSPPSCSGLLSIDFNAWMASDDPLPAGTEVHAQFRYKDKADPWRTGLTDAIRFCVEP